jgi:hypothetical protein
MPGAAHLRYPVYAYKAVFYNTGSFVPCEQVQKNDALHDPLAIDTGSYLLQFTGCLCKEQITKQ